MYYHKYWGLKKLFELIILNSLLRLSAAKHGWFCRFSWIL